MAWHYYTRSIVQVVVGVISILLVGIDILLCLSGSVPTLITGALSIWTGLFGSLGVCTSNRNILRMFTGLCLAMFFLVLISLLLVIFLDCSKNPFLFQSIAGESCRGAYWYLVHVLALLFYGLGGILTATVRLYAYSYTF